MNNKTIVIILLVLLVTFGTMGCIQPETPPGVVVTTNIPGPNPPGVTNNSIEIRINESYIGDINRTTWVGGGSNPAYNSNISYVISPYGATSGVAIYVDVDWADTGANITIGYAAGGSGNMSPNSHINVMDVYEEDLIGGSGGAGECAKYPDNATPPSFAITDKQRRYYDNNGNRSETDFRNPERTDERDIRLPDYVWH